MGFSLLLNDPLSRWLSPLGPFHYLDRSNPTIVKLTPDIAMLDVVDSNTHTFSVVCDDDCSGFDSSTSTINLYRMKNNKYETFNGSSSISGNRIDYMVDTELTHGEYLMQIIVSDRATNRSESEYRFIVPERQIISISGVLEKYEEEKHAKLFRSFLKERAEMLDLHLYRLYVYQYALRNTAQRTYCKSLHLSIGNQGVVFYWKEMGSLDCRGIVSLNLTESMQKNVPENMIFSSERLLSIDEIGPGGMAHFNALVGFMTRSKRPPRMSIPPEEILWAGTYVSEGYGRTTIEKIRRWVPIKKRNNGN